MKKTCKIVGRDGKVKGRASRRDVVGKALKAYLEGKDSAAFDFAMGLCRDRDEAQELVQEACYRVLRESRRYDPSRPVKSWLFAILRNVFVDSRRRLERKRGLSLDYLSSDGEAYLAETLAMNEEPILDRLEREESRALLRTVMARLTGIDRKALKLCDIDGIPFDAAARALRVPAGTLRSRLVRARRKLRAAVLKMGLR